MRVRAWLVLAITGAALILPGTSASACSAYCGLFFELNRTSYVPGEAATASGTVWVPENKQEGLLAKGPFYAWLVPQGSSLREGRAAPAGAMNVGALDVTTTKKSVVLAIRFDMPQLRSGWYTLAVCNDPCTQIGLGQSIEGTFFAAATPLERKLLIQQEGLQQRVWALQRDSRKADKQLAETRAELEAAATALADTRIEAAGLRDDLAAARQVPAPASPLVDAWAVVVAAAVIGAAIVLRRRRGRGDERVAPALSAAPPSEDPSEEPPRLIAV
jgi:hypothetical protein